MSSCFTSRSWRRLAERAAFALALALVAGASGCSDPVYVAPSATARASATSEPMGNLDEPGPGPDDVDAGAVDPEKPLELMRFQFTSAVKGREPVDRLWRARPGERVYAYVALRNRSGRPRKVLVSFRVNGKVRTEKELEVAESWNYRTWAYNTVKKDDKPGKLEVFITDEGHDVLVEESLPITP